MRQLLNTLFVASEDIYLSLDGENVVASRGRRGRWPATRSTPCLPSSPFPIRARHRP